MEKGENSLEKEIKVISKKFLEDLEDKEIFLISHFDTDGIASAAIMIQALEKLDKGFSVKIVKRLEEEMIYDLPKNKLILFLDLASGSLNHIKKAGLKDVFIIDHHEIAQKIPKGVTILNPMLTSKEKISSAGLVYLFCKEINPENKSLAKLAVFNASGFFNLFNCLKEKFHKPL